MSSRSQDAHAERFAELVRELRQLYGLGASFFRAAAARSGKTVTDLQVIDMLESSGPMTAGQLAELTGLTTGAVTGMLNRLEEAQVVRRERDPNDGRRVIVQLVRRPDEGQATGAEFADVGRRWEELAAGYDDAQLALLVEFLHRANAASREEIALLREAPAGEEGTFSAPLDAVHSGRLVIPSGILKLIVHAGQGMDDLYQARFDGPLPDVKAEAGVVTIRYPRRLLFLANKAGAADVTLNATIPWDIAIHGGALDVTADLGGLDLNGLEVKGGMSSIQLELPVPTRVVLVRLSGGASEITIRRPASVPARAHLKGWVSTFRFDDQVFSNVGNDVRLQSREFTASAPHYDIEVLSSASMVTISAG